MVKLSQSNWKTVKKTPVFRRTWGLKCTHGGILRGDVPPWGGVRRDIAPRHFLGFVLLQGAQKWRSGTRWGPNSVVYSPGHHQIFVSVSKPEWTSKFIVQKSHGCSTLVASVPKWEWPTQWLWHAQKRWCSFRLADRYKNLVMTRWVYNTVWTSSSARTSFLGTLKQYKSKKWRGAMSLRTPPQGGTSPLKIPPVCTF